MANDKLDMDSARLQALAGASGVAPAMIAPSAATSPAAEELGQVDAQIETLSKDLGPNNPTMIQLKAKRAALAVTAEQERSAARAAAGASSAGVGALDRAVAAAKARVLAQSDKIGKLTQLQAEVDLRRDEFDKTSARAAEFRQQAVSAETGITPLADAVTPRVAGLSELSADRARFDRPGLGRGGSCRPADGVVWTPGSGCRGSQLGRRCPASGGHRGTVQIWPLRPWTPRKRA